LQVDEGLQTDAEDHDRRRRLYHVVDDLENLQRQELVVHDDAAAEGVGVGLGDLLSNQVFTAVCAVENHGGIDVAHTPSVLGSVVKFAEDWSLGEESTDGVLRLAQTGVPMLANALVELDSESIGDAALDQGPLHETFRVLDQQNSTLEAHIRHIEQECKRVWSQVADFVGL